METARGIIGPKIVQLSIFVENRVGLLLRLTRHLESRRVHICALSIIDTADTAVIRMVVDNIPAAKKALLERNVTCYEADLIGVALPIERGVGITHVLSTLLRAEINVHYVYSLITRAQGNAVMALHVDSHEAAVKALVEAGLPLIGQDDIAWEGPPDDEPAGA